MRRTQIYLDEDQDKLLTERSKQTGRTKSDLIREALDIYLGRGGIQRDEWQERWRRTVDDTFGIAPYLPSAAEWLHERRRDAIDRQRMLDEHWRR